ncbi:MAG: hypothetical protein LBC64_05540 [Fibromonadaceae bacterium]|jgi:uncharacterized protein (TIGR02145 family)|nr:hypothetical protein [Fibromonadaceae bacterium]
MRKQFSKLALVAAFGLALTLALSCSSDDGPGGGGSGGGGGGSGGCPNAVTGNGTVTCGGQTYKTVVIDGQTWMAENLNYAATGGLCYNNDPDNCRIYGKLYDWATVMALSPSCNSTRCASQITENHRGICPDGWHVPSDDEWRTLEYNAGGETTAVMKLKSESGWDNYYSESGNGTDYYGFKAMPGSYSSDGKFYEDYTGSSAEWWTASEDGTNRAIYIGMNKNNSINLTHYNITKDYFHSVRCVKNDPGSNPAPSSPSVGTSSSSRGASSSSVGASSSSAGGSGSYPKTLYCYRNAGESSFCMEEVVSDSDEEFEAIEECSYILGTGVSSKPSNCEELKNKGSYCVIHAERECTPTWVFDVPDLSGITCEFFGGTTEPTCPAGYDE